MTIDRRALMSLGTAVLLESKLARAFPMGEKKAVATRAGEVKTAGIRLIPVDGKYKVWTKKKMGRAIPRSRVAICENGSHLAMWDDQEAYFRHLIRFLKDVDAGRA